MRFIVQMKQRRDGMLAIDKTLILCGVEGTFLKYVPVFLFDKNVLQNSGGDFSK